MAIRKGKKPEDSAKDCKIMTQYSLKEDLKCSARILLVEDNPVNQKLAGMMLGKAGYHVEIAGNGLEAVEKFTATPDDFDLIFMDVQMPVMDGYAATRRIRQWEGQNRARPVPILALTAHALPEEVRKSLDAGCTAHLTKPIRKPVLLEAIREFAAPGPVFPGDRP